MLLAALCCVLPSAFAWVIYGEDSRQEFYELTDPAVIKAANSTMVFTIRGLIMLNDNGDYEVTQNSLRNTLNLCPEVKFSEQAAAGVCSSVLISSRHVLTAGHCMPDQNRCDEIYLAFDYHIKTPGELVQTMKKENVYRCKKLLVREQNGRQDFALIELDREVTDREPVEIEREKILNKGDKVRMTGYPDGLPSKTISGAIVRKAKRSEDYFVSNLDAFKGNSGSPVFSEETGRLAGILFKGDRDYLYNKERNCYGLRFHDEFGGRGEDATNIASIWPKLKPFLEN